MPMPPAGTASPSRIASEIVAGVHVLQDDGLGGHLDVLELGQVGVRTAAEREDDLLAGVDVVAVDEDLQGRSARRRSREHRIHGAGARPPQAPIRCEPRARRLGRWRIDLRDAAPVVLCIAARQPSALIETMGPPRAERTRLGRPRRTGTPGAAAMYDGSVGDPGHYLYSPAVRPGRAGRLAHTTLAVSSRPPHRGQRRSAWPGCCDPLPLTLAVPLCGWRGVAGDRWAGSARGRPGRVASAALHAVQAPVLAPPPSSTSAPTG